MPTNLTFTKNGPKLLFPTLPTSSASNSRNHRDPLLSSSGISRSVRQSIDTSADEDEHRPNLPPPALSTQSSVQSITSTALRSNNPGDGTNSLALTSRRVVSCRPVSRRVVLCRVVSCLALHSATSCQGCVVSYNTISFVEVRRCLV